MLFQLGSGLLDTCVLSVVSRGDAYGYTLTQKVKKVVDISESTLYPVLRRLQKDGYLTTYDEAIAGRNRRYYRLTDSGKVKLDEAVKDWKAFSCSVDELLMGGDINE